MAESGGGAVVNISSLSARLGAANAMVYAVAKAGLNNLTLSFAELLSPTVRVNAVLPGAVQTDVMATWTSADRERAEAAALMRRVGRPEEILGAVHYLVSDAASFTTGALLSVDDGHL